MEQPEISVRLVRQMIAAQFPQWADLPVTPVEPGGWDNRTFRLGERMSVRLPRAERYAQQIEKERRWLPRLAPLLPLSIPVPIAHGAPYGGYPWRWSIYSWLPGEVATVERIADLTAFAVSLAQFLNALQRIDPADGPAAGPHCFYRGGPLSVYDAETRHALAALGNTIDAEAARIVWETALQAQWQGPPVWFHGDVAAGNLLICNGRLSAVIDFGCCGVGDPACDTTIAWTLLSGESRKAFCAAMQADRSLWARGRGWALWKALITLAAHIPSSAKTQQARRVAQEACRVIEEVLADHRQSGV